MIILEGADNSGKTTLAREIAAKYGLEVMRSEGPNASYEWWINQLKVPFGTSALQIRDRFFFSEFIYGPIFRGRVRLTTHQTEVIRNLLVSLDPLIIRCQFVYDRAAFENRPQVFDFETQIRVDDAFKRFDFSPFRVVDFDWRDNPSVARTWAAVMEWFAERDHLVARHEPCAYGRGPVPARFMVVGINFSSNNPYKIPFERSVSAHMVHDFLRGIGLDPILGYYTNAEKDESGLTPNNLSALRTECQMVVPNQILSFGKVPSMMLSVLGRDHVAMSHPGAFIRRGANQEFFAAAQAKYADYHRAQA